MAIIDFNPPSPPTAQQQLAAAVAAQQSQVSDLWRQITSVMGGMANFIYACPLKKDDGTPWSPQDVFNAWGNNAADLCKLSDAALGMMAAYAGAAPQIPPAGITLTRNPNGTVTVSIAQ